MEEGIINADDAEDFENLDEDLQEAVENGEVDINEVL